MKVTATRLRVSVCIRIHPERLTRGELGEISLFKSRRSKNNNLNLLYPKLFLDMNYETLCENTSSPPSGNTNHNTELTLLKRPPESQDLNHDDDDDIMSARTKIPEQRLQDLQESSVLKASVPGMLTVQETS